MSNLRPLVIDDVIRARIAEHVQYAMKHRLSVDDILDIVLHRRPAPGDREESTTFIPFGFKCVFTIDAAKGPKLLKDIWARHISISIASPPELKLLPSPVAVDEILKQFGFTLNHAKCTTVFEPLKNGGVAINLYELFGEGR